VKIIIQDVQVHIDSNIFDICKTAIEEEEISMSKSESFLDISLTNENKTHQTIKNESVQHLESINNEDGML
jgi:hypothetical protein